MYVYDIDHDCKATSVVASRHGHVHGYKMASNIQLTTGRDREIAGLIKTKFKRHILEEFHDYSWAFVLGTARDKALGWLEKKKKRKMTKLDFHHFQVCHFKSAFEC